ncbi:hypothetical protein AMK16_11855 [Streptomyces sp. CB00455]|uniref:hypothetical protein n=1 Tax=Streptomyces sp. CB00455 TaxID=1703927 RepID=UPI000939141F|nr:hypothetical protein [Streptomyces sp. CB00455]OKK21058.1 hypothetical protein AMK16_11855 [Streptomyces sp. CB00455]
MHAPRFKAVLTCAAAASIVLAALPAARAVDGPAPDRNNHRAMLDMATAYRVTAKYQNERAAIADGYIRTDDCMSNKRGPGAMGYHYLNPSRWGSTDPSRPTSLIYGAEKGPGGRKLYAVEWQVSDPDQNLATHEGRPTMFGLPFDGPMPGHTPGMPIHFDLHMWGYKDNPQGRFHNWNLNVTCPAPSSHEHS